MTKIELLIQEANKEWGNGIIIIPEFGGEMINEKPEVVSSGFTFIDDALGIGGIACGRITEIMGQEAGGKTTLALTFLAKAQKMGKRCAFIDTEHALDRPRAEAIGVDFQKLAISQPDNMEQALELLEFIIRSNQFGLIVVDSVASMVPKAELEGEMDEANIGVKARMMGKLMRKIVPAVNKNKIALIFTNQVRAKLGGFGFIPQETTPGGNALKFAASLRLDVKRTGNKKRGETLLYTTHKMTVKKNKLAAPARVAMFNINGSGIMNDIVKMDDV